jgi:hypothetical protein
MAMISIQKLLNNALRNAADVVISIADYATATAVRVEIED